MGNRSASDVRRGLFHDADLILRQAVEFVDEEVNPPVGRFDLPLEDLFVVRRPGLRQLPVQRQRPLDALGALGLLSGWLVRIW